MPNLVIGLAAWVAAVGLVAHSIGQVQRDGRHQLERRFAIRADSGARFIEVYAQEVLRRERAQAVAQLTRPTVAQLTRPTVARRQFDGVVAGCGHQAAVLLDAAVSCFRSLRPSPR